MQENSNSSAEQSEESHLPRTNPELKIINDALRASEERFRAIINQSNTGIAECDLAGRFIFINKRFADITGYAEETLSSLYLQNTIYPDDAAEYNKLFVRLVNERTDCETELRCARADGSPVPVHIYFSLLTDIHNQPFSFIATIRKADNAKLPEAKEEEKSLAILDNITDAFFIVNSNWQFTYINRKAEQLNEREHDSLLGKVVWEEFPALVNSEYGDLYRRVAEQQTPGSVTALSAVDNQWYEVHAFPAKDRMIAYFKNVTEQKEAEEALRKSEESFRTLFNTIDEGFCIVEILFDKENNPCNYRFLQCNKLFEEMTGLKGALGKTVLELDPNLNFFWIKTYGNVALTGEPVRFENKIERTNQWFSVYASRADDTGSHKVVIVFTNITQRKLIERDRERFLALGSDLQAIGGPDNRFAWVSSAWERVLGYTAEELTSLSWKEFVHPDDKAKTEAEAEKNFSEEVIAWENRYRNKDGSYRWFSWNSKPYPGEGCTYGVATDITERKEAEEALRESEERYSAIIHQATAGVVEIDLGGNHLFVNKKWCEMTGFSEEEMYKLKFFDYVHPDDVMLWKRIFLQTAATGRPFISEKRIICKDKTEVWINETISSISDAYNNTKSIVAVCIDITDRKTIEKQKDEFIGVVSHELKTPVTSLKAYAQVLQMRFANAGDQTSANMLQKMENQINRLNILVQDLLDITRLEGKMMQFRREVFEFGTMVTNTVEEVQRTLSSHTIVCRHIPPAAVYADIERTSQVLVNFLTNAAKYSPGADRIIVSAYVENDGIVCSVTDFGIGIPAESHQYIFDRFYRVTDSKRNTFPGLGLGLYISSEIIKNQQGDIWFTSSVNEGSVFSFRLPLYHQEQPL